MKKTKKAKAKPATPRYAGADLPHRRHRSRAPATFLPIGDSPPHDPARDIPNPRLSRNTSSDPTGNRLLAKIAGIQPAADPSDDGAAEELEFRHRVLKVEEGFRAELDDEARARLGAIPESGGGTEGKYEPQMVSTGWWVSLEGWPVAMRFGTGKPSIAAGDTLVLIARVIKETAAP